MKKLLSFAAFLLLLVAVAQSQTSFNGNHDTLTLSAPAAISIGMVLPNYSIEFMGQTDSIYFGITFMDTLKIVTHMPLDSCAKLFVEAVNKYYNWHVDSLKQRIRFLEGRRNGN